MAAKPRHVLALSSGGGHWIQLKRVLPAFEGQRLTCASVHPDLAADVPYADAFHVVPDANRWSKIALLQSAFGVLRLLVKLRPDVVITTGAAPGWFALVFAKKLGARTVWLDSVANAEEMSLSGQKAGRHADLWLTQWEHVARPEGPHYAGSVLGSWSPWAVSCPSHV